MCHAFIKPPALFRRFRHILCRSINHLDRHRKKNRIRAGLEGHFGQTHHDHHHKRRRTEVRPLRHCRLVGSAFTESKIIRSGDVLAERFIIEQLAGRGNAMGIWRGSSEKFVFSAKSIIRISCGMSRMARRLAAMRIWPWNGSRVKTSAND
jgi:hypothetical protein